MNEATNNVNDNVEYEITSETTCEVVKVERELTEVTIPEAVIIDGKQYAVTAVAGIPVRRFQSTWLFQSTGTSNTEHILQRYPLTPLIMR